MGGGGGQPLPDSPLSSDGSAVATDDATGFEIIGDTEVRSAREYLGNSLDFFLPLSWINQSGPVELEFELTDPVGESLECAEPDGNSDCQALVTFDPWTLRQIDFHSVPYNSNHQFELEVDATGGTYVLTTTGNSSDPIQFDASAEDVEDEVKDLLNVGLNHKRVSVSCSGCGGSGKRTYWILVLRGQPEVLALNDGSLDGIASIKTTRVGGRTLKPTDRQMLEQVQRVTDVFPTKRIDFRLRDFASLNRAPNLSKVNTGLVVARWENRVRDPFGTQPHSSFGVLLESGPDAGGMAVGDVASWFTDDTEGPRGEGYARNRAGHEVAHVYSQGHAVTAPGNIRRVGICNAKAGSGTPFHPFVEDTGITNPFSEPSGQTLWPLLGPLSLGPDDEVWGTSPRAFANGLPESLVVTDPRFSAALMSYCSTFSGQGRWVSSSTYSDLVDGYGRGGAESRQPTRVGTADYVLVTGTVDPENGAVALSPLITVSGSDPGYDPGRYSCRHPRRHGQ